LSRNLHLHGRDAGGGKTRDSYDSYDTHDVQIACAVEKQTAWKASAILLWEPKKIRNLRAAKENGIRPEFWKLL